ncbi:Ankyrin and armadillo repeat-containing [Gossypium australe]|uniref:Ankyrin and armadillo repeat-containing n=1 Tax=Gossypium australe TaxID=47621 RepID=A0A5B6W083_9ROSI|nr:Ankyrin and armadillo repeat-containing [Gossypium australe]
MLSLLLTPGGEAISIELFVEVSHQKLLMHAEETAKIQLNNAEKRIKAVREASFFTSVLDAYDISGSDNPGDLILGIILVLNYVT